MGLLDTSHQKVLPDSFREKFRESFESFTNGVFWTANVAAGDIVQLDGNALSASYLVISKDPLTVNTKTYIETIDSFGMPVELAVGAATSQRTVGQDLYIEMVRSDTASIAAPADIAINNISQSTTTLTVVANTAHNLVPGMRVGIFGSPDSRFNYASLVVASTPNTTVFTATAGPQGTIPSVTAGPVNGGTIYRRLALDGATDGTAMAFENTANTNASFYSRSNSGDTLPSGTLTGNHSTTISNTSATQGVSAPYAYTFLPQSEYRLALQADRMQWMDQAVDTLNAFSSRYLRTQVVPGENGKYKLRFRAVNNDGLTIPVAQIVSITKTSSTTATVTTNVAHGLTTTDVVNIYGVRDQTNFPNLTAATAVASTPTSTTFTIVIGPSATATSYGGYVSRVNGSFVQLGAIAQSIQSASVVASPGPQGGNELQLVGSANWAGLFIGDYVNVLGMRNIVDGTSLGLDGTYKVANIATTTLTLLPIGSTTLGSTLASTNCGGGVIKRTDLRIFFARIFDYERQRVEVLTRPNNDQSASIPVQGTVTVTGTVSVNPHAFSNNILVTDISSGAITSTATSNTIAWSNGLSMAYSVIVTAVSGTNPTMDTVIQESPDNGTNWFDVYHLPRITATGTYLVPPMPVYGTRLRYVRTLGGTSPSFTNSVNRVQIQGIHPIQRQFFNRTIVPNTLNSTTTTYYVNGITSLTCIISMGAITTTAPVFVVEASHSGVTADTTSWYQLGTDITGVANEQVRMTVDFTLANYVRVRVKTAGSGATLNYVMVQGG